MSFLRKSWGPIRLAIATQFEYRFNLLVDAVLQPSVSAIVEISLWYSVLMHAPNKELNGFGVASYTTYALWVVFFARVSANWMYEFKMINEIESGRINGLLVRPYSFYSFYLGQFMGYKALTCGISFFIPVAVSLIFGGATDFSRLPLALLMLFSFLIFAHTLSFIVASLTFFMNKTQGITSAKNIFIWLLSGELIPLDLFPPALKVINNAMPFSCGAYLPVAFITHRIGLEPMLKGFEVLFIWTIGAALLARFVWHRGLRAYSGTGA